MKIVNLTPHDINLKMDNETICYPKSENVARVKESNTKVKFFPFPTVLKTYEKVENLPDVYDSRETIYIVSQMVLSALQFQNNCRNDVIAPDTGYESAIRNDKGMIIAVKRFMIL